MNNSITISSYDEHWPEIFANEAALIQAALGSNCVAVHHVGSTAIPGMSAKPIIDMIPAVTDITAVDHANEAMRQLGYVCNGEAGMLFRRFFTKNGFNIHVYETDAGELDRLLKFRDWMRTHPDDAAAYAELKIRLANQYSNERFRYTMNKENFVASIDKKTGFDGVRIVKALTDREWEAYRRLVDQRPDMSDPAQIYLVLYKGSEVVGAAHLQFLSAAEEVALRKLGIDVHYQHASLDARFRTDIERWLQQQHCKLVKE